MLRWRRGRVAALTQSCPLKKGRQWSGRLVRWCMAIARGVLALLSIVPALSAFLLALSVLAEGGPTTVSASFFAFAMFAEAASLAIAARKLPPSVWAETQGATFAASPLTLSVLAKGAAIAFWHCARLRACSQIWLPPQSGQYGFRLPCGQRFLTTTGAGGASTVSMAPVEFWTGGVERCFLSTKEVIFTRMNACLLLFRSHGLGADDFQGTALTQSCPLEGDKW